MQEKTKHVLFLILQWTWGLPQNLLGMVFLVFSKSKGKRIHLASHRYWRLQGGISLGVFIFLEEMDDKERERKVLLHEYGHTLQSLYLGPFYLLVIGVPSFLWATCCTFLPFFRKKNYYRFYTEAWANHLVKHLL